MSWIAPVASSIGGGLIANKGAKQAAQTAAQGQIDLSNQMFDKATAYQQQQQQALRNAISGMGPMVGNLFNAGTAMRPTYQSPAYGGSSFHGGNIPGAQQNKSGSGSPGAVQNKSGASGQAHQRGYNMGQMGMRAQPPTDGPFPSPSPPPGASAVTGFVPQQPPQVAGGMATAQNVTHPPFPGNSLIAPITQQPGLTP